MKELFRSLIIAGLTAFAIPIALFVAKQAGGGLGKIGGGIMKLGGRISAPLGEAGKMASGRLANWGASRGVLGRTVARVGTGAIFPGGRARMERIGTAYTKARSERQQARGSYRATPSSRMNAEALERTSVEAIQRWVNDPRMADDVASLRQMVVDTPSIKLSTAQRKALFSGMGTNPNPGRSFGSSLVPGPAGSGPVPGAPTPLAPSVPLPLIDRPVGGQSPAARWWSERPTLLPGVRQASQPRGPLGLGYVAAHYSGSGSRQWRGWMGRAPGIPGTPPPAAPAPNPPPPPGSPFAP